MAHGLGDHYRVASIGEASNAVGDSTRYLHSDTHGMTDVESRLLQARHGQATATAASASQHHGQVATAAAAAVAAATPSETASLHDVAFPLLHAAAPDEEIRDQDRFLPIANVARVMKKHIPSNGKISKEAKECMQECVSEFISFLTSEACDRCQTERRKTITGEDILFSMQVLGFDNYLEPLKLFLLGYRENVRGLTGGSKYDLPPYDSALSEADSAAAAGAVASASAATSDVSTPTTSTGGAAVATTADTAVAVGGTDAENFINSMGNFQYNGTESNEDAFIDVDGPTGLMAATATGHHSATVTDSDGVHHVHISVGSPPYRQSAAADEVTSGEFTMMPTSELTQLQPSSFS